jgi:hypothetical protein
MSNQLHYYYQLRCMLTLMVSMPTFIARTLQGSVHCAAKKIAVTAIQPIWMDCSNKVALSCDNTQVACKRAETLLIQTGFN